MNCNNRQVRSEIAEGSIPVVLFQDIREVRRIIVADYESPSAHKLIAFTDEKLKKGWKRETHIRFDKATRVWKVTLSHPVEGFGRVREPADDNVV